MESHRAERVSEALRAELEELIGYEMEDPRIGAVHVTAVQVAPDLRHARVQVGLEGDPQDHEGTLKALEGARHFLRRQLARRLQLYRIPELHFEPDAAVAGDRIEQLLKRIHKK